MPKIALAIDSENGPVPLTPEAGQAALARLCEALGERLARHAEKSAAEDHQAPDEAAPDVAAPDVAAPDVAAPEEAAQKDAVAIRWLHDALEAEPEGPMATLLSAILSASPYLASLAEKEAAFLSHILRAGADQAQADAMALAAIDARMPDGAGLPAAAEPLKALMRRLRVAKRRIALTTAIADAAGAWTLDQITRALSDIADAALDCAVAHCVGELTGTAQTGDGCGLVVLGMGKLGAYELNYSSDIDIMIFYDPDRLGDIDPDRMRQETTRAARTLMRIMDERTRDGYVFRTDTRLRPDPSVTPLAITVRAAETYYESLGQNWERAAMIKARPVAGDKALGEAFLRHIRPFIWRKHLDFATISDIQSIKRQINAYRGGGEIAVAGHDVKIGRGGIREIEFYVQTQQLIWGGREPELRTRRTLEGLQALAAQGHTTPEATQDMTRSYHFLRTLEHRLQMTNDEQTQTLPESAEKLAVLGGFMGFAQLGDFQQAVRSTLQVVEAHYARLFEEAPKLGGGGALSFTGTDDDPDTIKTLRKTGYQEPARVAERIRSWHHGRYRATRSERSRQILTELTPRLLKALADTADPDEAFLRFDAFLEGLPAGVQLFSLFYANPHLLDLVAEIMGSAPRLAEWLTRKPILLDAVLSPEFFDRLEDKQGLAEQLAEALGQARDFQDILDITRRWANDRKFQNGVQLLRGITDPEQATRHLSAVAQVSLQALLRVVEEEFADGHGHVPGGGLAIVAFGKLGGEELMPRSDLDLVFVYDHDVDADGADGKKPLGSAVYYLRLCQRLVTAISIETGEGKLFEVDNRLRPDGKAGPLATQFTTFRDYYQPQGKGGAWTWEHMALTRARAVAGPPALCEKINAVIADNLNQEREPAQLVQDVAHMRARIAKEFPGKTPWQVKYRAGGLVDVEFIAQYLQLRSGGRDGGGREGGAVFSANTGVALDQLCAAGDLDEDAHRDLREGLDLWRRLQIGLRLSASEGTFAPDTAPEGQCRLLVRIAGAKDFDSLTTQMEAAAQAVATRFSDIITGPASDDAAPDKEGG
jgi:glutamate-ammonia-ligase adenylyltransferase